jgi:hypothetical protein
VDLSPPTVVTSYDDVATGLQRLRLHAGVSYRELHRRVVRERRRRRVPEVPAYDTVYRCLQTGRRRLDVELVAEVVRALGGDLAAVADWRAACAAAARHQLQDSSATASVEVSAIPAEPEVDLIGRSAELTALTATPGRWLIVGMPGVGKTALALAAAAELRRSGTVDAAWLIRLRGWAEETAPDRATLTEAVQLTLGPRADQRVALVVDDIADPARPRRTGVV